MNGDRLRIVAQSAAKAAKDHKIPESDIPRVLDVEGIRKIIAILQDKLGNLERTCEDIVVCASVVMRVRAAEWRMGNQLECNQCRRSRRGRVGMTLSNNCAGCRLIGQPCHPEFPKANSPR